MKSEDPSLFVTMVIFCGFSECAVDIIKNCFNPIMHTHSAEFITEEKPDERSELEEFPLTKSLGYSINKNLDQLKRTLGNDRMSQEYAEQYFDMMRLSRESFEKFDDDEERRPRRLAAGGTSVAKDGVPDRRRSASRFRSAAGQRRQRSQATRRDKLKSQGLRSHLLHTKHILDYNEE